jgi:hypothetical protein
LTHGTVGLRLGRLIFPVRGHRDTIGMSGVSNVHKGASMSEPYLAAIICGRLYVRARNGAVIDKDEDWTLDGLDPDAYDLGLIQRDLAGELCRVRDV